MLAAASPRPVAAEYPRRGRGGTATRLHGIIHVFAAASPRPVSVDPRHLARSLRYVFIFRTVRVAARDARRLEAAAHGPCYAHFNDAIRGRETIRAFGAIDRFEAANLKLTDAMATGRYANEAASKWSQALTTQNGCLLYLAAGLTSVALVARGDMTTGQLGLVLLYSASLQRAAMDYMTGLTTLESQFVSVERVAQYPRPRRILPSRTTLTEHPRRRRDPSPRNIHVQPRRRRDAHLRTIRRLRRDAPLRTIHVFAAASPRAVSAEDHPSPRASSQVLLAGHRRRRPAHAPAAASVGLHAAAGGGPGVPLAPRDGDGVALRAAVLRRRTRGRADVLSGGPGSREVLRDDDAGGLTRQKPSGFVSSSSVAPAGRAAPRHALLPAPDGGRGDADARGRGDAQERDLPRPEAALSSSREAAGR